MKRRKNIQNGRTGESRAAKRRLARFFLVRARILFVTLCFERTGTARPRDGMLAKVRKVHETCNYSERERLERRMDIW